MVSRTTSVNQRRAQFFIIEETIKYIEQLEDDNESLQVALEGTIWSPKKWNEPLEKYLNRRKEPETLIAFLALFFLLFTNYRRAFKSFANFSKPGLPNKANMLRLLVKIFP